MFNNPKPYIAEESMWAKIGTISVLNEPRILSLTPHEINDKLSNWAKNILTDTINLGYSKINCDTENIQECSICLCSHDNFDFVKTAKCKHVFHESCLKL